MKKYKWTIELEVSEQNKPLIPLLVNLNGSRQEEETEDDAVLRIVSDKIDNIIKQEMILNNLQYYFGLAGQSTTDSIKESLENGALSSTSICETM